MFLIVYNFGRVAVSFELGNVDIFVYVGIMWIGVGGFRVIEFLGFLQGINVYKVFLLLLKINILLLCLLAIILNGVVVKIEYNLLGGKREEEQYNVKFVLKKNDIFVGLCEYFNRSI